MRGWTVTLLLSDIRDIIGDRDKIASAELANSLADMEDRPWPEFNRGNPISAAKIARLLKPFGIRSGTIRVTEGTAKGYTEKGLNDAFARYLPSQSVTTSQVNVGAGYSDFQSVTRKGDVTLSNPLKATVGIGCDVVTLSNPGNREVDTVSASNCVHCGQPIEPDQETVPHHDGELHAHCYSESVDENWSIDL